MTQPASKRTACDRCRAHKLRCPQPEGLGGGPCTRCERAGAACVTSGAKPTGRPRKARGAAVFGDGLVPGDPAELSGVSAPDGRLPEPILGLEADGAGRMAWMDDDPEVLLGHQPALDGNPWPNFEQFQHLTMDLNLPNSESFLGGTGVCPGAAFGAESGMDDTLLPANPGTEDILVALARLSEGISQQLSRSKAFQRKPDAPAEANPSPPRTPNVNGVAVALKCTSDFTKILQAIPPGTGGGPRDLGSMSLSPVSTPTALLTLSSYLQLIYLYDTIFRCLCRIFRENPDSIGKCPASADSQFQVAGVSTIDGRLYVKLLIQVIEHHIDGLEKLLGLPAEFAVSGRERNPEGVLSNAELRDIANLVMSRADGPEGSGGSRVISLRDAIKETKDLL